MTFIMGINPPSSLLGDIILKSFVGRRCSHLQLPSLSVYRIILVMASNIVIEETSNAQPQDMCLYFRHNGQRISPWHDIPLFADRQRGILIMVVEIPRGTNAKMEVSVFVFISAQ